jgi:hypothetical protein
MFTEKRFAQAAPTNATPATVYTLPTATLAIVKNCILCNTSASDVAVYFYCVPSGGSAGASNAVLYKYVVPAYTTFKNNMYLILDTAGDFLAVAADAAGVTITITGAVVT